MEQQNNSNSGSRLPLTPELSFRRGLSEHPELEELSEQVGGFIEHWGFKKIHGKIWTHLYLSKSPLDATSLVKRLKVSKALVSFSIHDLLDYDVIREVGRGRGRMVLYEANPDVTAVIVNVLKKRELKMLSDVSLACGSLKAKGPLSQPGIVLDSEKIELLSEFIIKGQMTLQWLIASSQSGINLFPKMPEGN